MCGIVGLIDLSQERIPPALLACLRDAMSHRGPDGSGEFFDRSIALGMRRLSVIDPEAGWQPLHSAGGDVVAFQNGEIYNYVELRGLLQADGHAFRTASDTEVLAHGYVQWGIEGLLERLDGMFAMAILDRRSRVLHIARDRFGEKPLFFAWAPEKFAYSSSLLALAALPWVGDSIDPIGLDRYLALHYVPGRRTILAAIKRVLPGERLEVPLDSPVPEPRQYYNLRLDMEQDVGTERLAALIEHAVTSRLVADVPVGVFLSGGLDSATVAALAARAQPGIATFSIGFPTREHDESAHAQAMAGEIGSSHHRLLFDNDSFRRLLPEVVGALDEPIGDQAMLPLYWLAREARKHVTVVLSGEGADEIFAGYSYYRDLFPFAALLGRDVFGAQSLVDTPTVRTPSGFPLLTDTAGRRRLTGQPVLEDLWDDGLLWWLRTTDDRLRRATAADIATWLPDDLLVKFDRMTMAHGLEGRAPFLQKELVEAAVALPAKLRMSGGTSKVALRHVAARWLPDAIAARPKQGFVLPMEPWLSAWFAGHGGPESYFHEREIEGLDRRTVTELVASDLSEGVKRPRLVFALVALVEWRASFRARLAALRNQVAAAYAGASSTLLS